MKNIFSSDRRKFLGLLAGVAALPLTALEKQVDGEVPEPVKKQALVIDASGNLGIGVNNPSCVLHIQSSSASSIRLMPSGLPLGSS